MADNTLRRVAVTGLGVVSPLGNTPETLFANLINGRSGIGRLQTEFVDTLDNKIAAQADFNALEHFTKSRAGSLDRVSQFSLYASAQALADAKLSLASHDLSGQPAAGGYPASNSIDKSRIGIYLGTGMAGAGSVEEGYVRLYRENASRLKPFTVLMAMNNAPASQIAMEYQLAGPNLTFCTACSSSTIAIGEAYRQIRHGYADVMLAGGSEALLTFGTIKAWEALRTLAKEDPEDAGASCKPFAANRSGLVLGEGAAIVVLEDMAHARQRGARIYGELTGYGTANDSTHITQPTADGQSRSMLGALQCANLQPQDIGYINAHGTGTQLNDVTETAAIKRVFGEAASRLAVSSTKSMHGHLMGAAGALEFIITTLALTNQALPPTMHLHYADPQCDLDYVPNQARQAADMQHAMSNSFAFGGTGGVLIISKMEA